MAPGPSPGLHFRLCHVGAWGNRQHILLKPPLFTGKREDGEKPCRWACWSLGTQGMASPPPAFFLTELGTCSARGCLLGNEGPLLCVLGFGALSRELPHAGAGVRGVTLAW